MSFLQNLPIKTRSLKEGDLNLIYSTWLKSYRSSPFASYMSNDTYYDNHKKYLEKILHSPTTEVTILCEIDDEDHIYCYMVSEKGLPVVHYLYVKYTYRKMGFAKALMAPLLSTGQEIEITHANNNYRAFAKKYPIRYNPYYVFRR